MQFRGYFARCIYYELHIPFGCPTGAVCLQACGIRPVLTVVSFSPGSPLTPSVNEPIPGYPFHQVRAANCIRTLHAMPGADLGCGGTSGVPVHSGQLRSQQFLQSRRFPRAKTTPRRSCVMCSTRSLPTTSSAISTPTTGGTHWFVLIIAASTFCLNMRRSLRAGSCMPVRDLT